MRGGGTRLVAAAAALVLAGAAGCSDPAGAERKLVAEARSKSPSPTASSKAKARPRTPIWRQPPGVTRSNAKAGLRVKTGHLFEGRVTVVVTDTKSDVHRTITASAKPRREEVGRYVLTAVKLTSAGISFAYRLR